MKAFKLLAVLAHCLGAAAQVHTGFCYGSHWDPATPKTYEDFKRAFEAAQKIEGAGVKFNSARLFSSLQWNSDKPIEAFQAAIDTNTTLLLGIWLGNGQEEAELKALDEAFAEHGEKLANLVVGVSVGSEDIFRNSEECEEENGTPCLGATVEEVKSNITVVRDHFASAPYADLMKDKPIGHVDIVKHTLLEDVDFIGATVYPFWNAEPIDEAEASFQGSMSSIEEDAGNIPVWITETGWPFSGPNIKQAEASTEDAQRYWTKIGCPLFGKYNVWWFELEDDAYNEEYDWAVLAKDRSPRIDFRCPNVGTSTTTPSGEPTTNAPPVSKAPSPTTSGPTSSAKQTPTTLTVTQTECVTVAVYGNKQTTTVATNTLKNSQVCVSPPPVTLAPSQVPVPPPSPNETTASPTPIPITDMFSVSDIPTTTPLRSSETPPPLPTLQSPVPTPTQAPMQPPVPTTPPPAVPDPAPSSTELDIPFIPSPPPRPPPPPPPPAQPFIPPQTAVPPPPTQEFAAPAPALPAAMTQAFAAPQPALPQAPTQAFAAPVPAMPPAPAQEFAAPQPAIPLSVAQFEAPVPAQPR
ncbi:glycoside hydrolase family 17 protein [Sporormia fimetaria CBS 119925]|uniref:glucan endo-1,3-beta-D-glucosidase n=1 Tax=Sporormia fimetaria CBS 119925 TaxID=1340428 RepID=A0A6A6VPB7_9PLEO|nr:glycoside hydrolase family 17 protein [Sporormia fimetaria CBS 119925]